MSNIDRSREGLVKRILDGPGDTPTSERRAAFNDSGLSEPVTTLVDKIAKQPSKITDEDITSARMSGLSEDQVFELVVCAAVGQATRQYETALAALEAATGKN
jgi:hypothetical protein